MVNLRERIEEILEQLWIDCNNTPTDGTIYDPIGILQDKAANQILQAFEEILPDKKDTFGAAIDIVRAPNIGFNICLAQIRERLI